MQQPSLKDNFSLQQLDPKFQDCLCLSWTLCFTLSHYDQKNMVYVDWHELGYMATLENERVVQIEMLLRWEKKMDSGQAKSTEIY